jgi:hypothetical protein
MGGLKRMIAGMPARHPDLAKVYEAPQHADRKGSRQIRKEVLYFLRPMDYSRLRAAGRRTT